MRKKRARNKTPRDIIATRLPTVYELLAALGPRWGVRTESQLRRLLVRLRTQQRDDWAIVFGGPLRRPPYRQWQATVAIRRREVRQHVIDQLERVAALCAGRLGKPQT